MKTVEYYLAFIFPILSYFLQIYPRFLNRHFGVDVWTILIETDLIRKNHHKIPNGIIKKGFILQYPFDYPPVFLILLSFLSKRFLEKYQGFIAPIFDALQNLLVFFIAIQLTHDIRIALLAQVIYTLTPVSALENSSLVPRSLGYLLFSLALYSLLFYVNTGSSNILFLLTGFIFSVLTILTHRFATQSLLFISIFFTFVDKTPLYLLTFLAAIIAAILVTKKYYLRVLKGHLSNIHFWMQNYPDRFAHQVYGHLPPAKNPDLIGILYKLLGKFAPISLLGSNVWVASGFILLFFTIPSSTLLFKMAIWIVFFYILAVIVLMIKSLTPIGEGYRYLEMIQVPTSILSSYLFFHFYNSPLKIFALGTIVSLLFINAAIILFLQRKAVIKDKNRTLTENMKDIFKVINKIPGTPRVMCIPHQMTTMIVYNTKADVLVGIDTFSVKFMKDFYPVLRRPIEDVAKKYKITHLLVRETFAKVKDLKIKKLKILGRAGDIVLIDLRSR